MASYIADALNWFNKTTGTDAFLVSEPVKYSTLDVLKKGVSALRSDDMETAVAEFAEDILQHGYSEYQPTAFDDFIDNLTDVGERVGDVIADVVEQKYNIDIPNMGSDEYDQDPVVSKSQANILGLMIPMSVIGLLFLL